MHIWFRFRQVMPIVLALLLIWAPGLALVQWSNQARSAPAPRPWGSAATGVEVCRAGGNTWTRITADTPLFAGDTVRAETAGQLTLAGGTRVTLGPGAMVALAEAEGTSPRLKLLAGEVRVETTDADFRLETPGEAATPTPGLTAGWRGAAFRVTLSPAGGIVLSAERGAVTGQTNGQEIVIREGDELRLQAGEALINRWPPAPPPPGVTPTPTITPTPTPIPTPARRIYIVQPGDTLLEIAIRMNSSVEAIVLANDLEDAHMLSIGQKLIIP